MRLNIFGIWALVVEVLTGGAIIGHENDQRILIEVHVFEIAQQTTDVIVEVVDHRSIEFHFA